MAVSVWRGPWAGQSLSCSSELQGANAKAQLCIWTLCGSVLSLPTTRYQLGNALLEPQQVPRWSHSLQCSVILPDMRAWTEVAATALHAEVQIVPVLGNALAWSSCRLSEMCAGCGVLTANEWVWVFLEEEKAFPSAMVCSCSHQSHFLGAEMGVGMGR